MSKKLSKMAADDAVRYGYAEMFYGEGAGTMRKLISAEVSDKIQKIPGYSAAFEAAYNKLDWAELAQKAMKNRKRIDGSRYVQKNVSAILRNDRMRMSNGVAIAVVTAGVLHSTGYDKIIVSRAKTEYMVLKRRWQHRKHLRSVGDDA